MALIGTSLDTTAVQWILCDIHDQVARPEVGALIPFQLKMGSSYNRQNRK